MKGFRKLSSIAILLCAFVYPPLLAEAKASPVSHSLNEQRVGAEANLAEGNTEEFLIADRDRRGRYRRGNSRSGRRIYRKYEWDRRGDYYRGSRWNRRGDYYRGSRWNRRRDYYRDSRDKGGIFIRFH